MRNVSSRRESGQVEINPCFRFFSFTGKARCSHFLSVCYLANVILHHKKVVGVPCPEGCLFLKKNRLPIYSKDIFAYPRYLRSMPFGNDAPEE